MKQKIFRIILLLSTPFITMAQSPSNDDPLGAITLPIVNYGGVANVITGTTVNATYTDTPSTPTNATLCGCTSFAPSNPNDVWYIFNTGSFNNFEITVNSSSYIGAPGYLRIYQDVSHMGNPIQCYCSSSSQEAVGTVYINGLSSNTDYFIAVSPKVGTNGFWGAFDINAFGSNTPLSITKTIDFTVQQTSLESNTISWKWLGEAQPIKYILQRKNFSSKQFEEIETIYSQKDKLNYIAKDFISTQGDVNQYRLAMISNNNRVTYSKIISTLTSKTIKQIQCIPNPGSESVKIIRDANISSAKYIISDYFGRKINQGFMDAGHTQKIIPTTAWPRGIYHIKIMNEGEQIPIHLHWIKK